MNNRIKAGATVDIQADRNKVWQVLTTPDKVKQFMLGMQPQSDWKEGSGLRWQGRHEEKPDDNARGKIVKMEAGSRLAYTFYYPGYGYPDQDEYYNLVSFELLPSESSTVVHVEQGDFSVFKEGEEFAKHSTQFWDMALQKLKELAEEALPPVAAAASADEAAIRALEERFATAFNAGDVDAMMKNYVPDQSLVVFDVVPPRQHSGADAYRKAWVGFFTHFRNRPKIDIHDLGITVNGDLGFSHSIQHVTGTDTEGRLVDRTVRVTDGYRKIGGDWLIALEHISVPVDLKTGKPDFTSKP